MALAQPYIHRVTLPHCDPLISTYLDIAADSHILAAISSDDTDTRLTFYDPAVMPRSPSIWGRSEQLIAQWPSFMADDGPLIA